jgi:hypothetical protein
MARSIRNALYIIRGFGVVYTNVIYLQYNLSVSNHLCKSIVGEADNTGVKWNRHSSVARGTVGRRGNLDIAL